MGFYFAYKPYVPVAKRRQQAAAKLKKLQSGGKPVAPVLIEGRTIASSFWGKSWCDNLERYSDYENRLPRGRSYVRNGSVLDLQIGKGEISARVSGSDLYTIKITVAPVPAARWSSLARDCAGTIDSMVELLQGRIDKGVMDRVCRQGDGLFPSPKEIKLSCSCPDWADMCKHVAAALYGVGARLDRQPELLFTLRGVDAQDMIGKAGAHLATPAPGSANDKVLAGDDMAALFGLDMAEEAAPSAAPAALPKRSQSERATKRMLAKAVAKHRGNAGPGPVEVPPSTKPATSKTGSRRTTAPALSLAPTRGRKPPNLAPVATPRRPANAKSTPQAQLEALIEEATVDAYTEAEQAVGLYTMICEHVVLPFKTKVLGREADVVEIEMGEDDRLLAICKVGRKRQRIGLADLALPAKRSAGAEWIIAYRHWCGRNGSG